MTAVPTLAPETTQLGLLQRGRGRGLQTALAGARTVTRDALAACLRNDPRWDPQLETRELYYADVATACGMPIEEIHGILRELAHGADDTRFYGQYQVAGVLGVLTARGDAAALRALTDEVHEGPAWHVAAEELADRIPRQQWLPLGEPLLARLSDAEVLKLAEDRYTSDPWAGWAESERRLQEAFTTFEAPGQAPPAQAEPYRKADTRMSTPELIAITEQRNWIKVGRVLEERQRPEDVPMLVEAVRNGTGLQRAVALRGLAALGNDSVLDDAAAIVQDAEFVMLRRSALNYLASLSPALTLERARLWLREPWPLALAGQEVLETHATRDDLDMLRETLAAASESGDMYKACFAADALGCFDAPEALPELRHFYEAAPYSYGRWRAARALSRIEGDFAKETAVECLYDCEPRVRLIGIELADRQQARVVGRLRQMATDAAEDPDVAARARRDEGESST